MAEQIDLQAVLQLRGGFTDELRNAIAETKRFEAALRDATNGTSNATANDIALLQRELGGAQRKVVLFSAGVDKLDAEIDQLGTSASQASGKITRMGQATGKAGGGFKGLIAAGKGAGLQIAAVAAGTTAAVIGIGKLNTAIGQYEQNVNKTRTVFAGQNREMRRWARAHRDDFGGSTQDTLNYAASLQDLIVPMGFARKTATGMTKDIAGLVPALTAWDKSGRSSAEITDILAGALTGERDALKGIGITISEDAVKAQIELMRSHGKLKGATDEQASAQATLALLYKKSGDAQKTYADQTDTVARRTKNLGSDVAEFRDQGLKTLLFTYRRVAGALNQAGLGNGLKSLTKWMRQNRNDIVGFFLQTGSIAAKVFSIWAKWESIILKGLGYLLGAISTTTHYLGYLIPGFEDLSKTSGDAADKIGALSEGFDAAAKKGGEISSALNDQANAAKAAQKRVDALREALAKVKNKDIRIRVRTTVTDAFSAVDAAVQAAKDAGATGDSRAPHGAGPSLGAGGLLAAHTAFARDLGGHRITSGIRHHNLGSITSDHARGRAMDITGPRLGSYAVAVRKAGGHAAFHGQGADRHLHVVPVTPGTPASPAAAGSNYHAEVHFHGAAPSPFNARRIVTGALRDAEREARERGGRR